MKLFILSALSIVITTGVLASVMTGARTGTISFDAKAIPISGWSFSDFPKPHTILIEEFKGKRAHV